MQGASALATCVLAATLALSAGVPLPQSRALNEPQAAAIEITDLAEAPFSEAKAGHYFSAVNTLDLIAQSFVDQPAGSRSLRHTDVFSGPAAAARETSAVGADSVSLFTTSWASEQTGTGTSLTPAQGGPFKLDGFPAPDTVLPDGATEAVLRAKRFFPALAGAARSLGGGLRMAARAAVSAAKASAKAAARAAKITGRTAAKKHAASAARLVNRRTAAGSLAIGALAEGAHQLPEIIRGVGRDPEGWSPLHFAVADGDLDKVGALLRAGADPNARDASGCTPLHYAVSLARLDLLDALIERGADPNAEDLEELTPLQYATSIKDKEKRFAVTKALVQDPRS